MKGQELALLESSYFQGDEELREDSVEWRAAKLL